VIDNIHIAQNISETFAAANVVLDVFIDLNTGMNRTGIQPSEKTLELFDHCKKLKGINITGLHIYDGHIRETDPAVRKQKTDEAFASVPGLIDHIEKETKKQLQIVAGGSPTFPVHAQRMNIECSPGTFIFWDYGYKNLLPGEPFDYAALVISRIISVVDKHTICTDLGHKSVAAENPLDKRVHFLNMPDAEPIGQSEEHLVLKVPESSAYKVGDVLYGVPVHICPTVALYERAAVVENNNAAGEWRVVARDKKINV
jgi:D-serine deaminase-like pyridoxal phosphate-dependent protein